MAIVRLTPEQKSLMLDLAREVRRDAQILCQHVQDDSSVHLLREYLEAIRDNATKALRVLGDTV